MPRPTSLVADILVNAAGWSQEAGSEAVVQRAVDTAAAATEAALEPSELAIMLTDDSGVQALNREWRGIDKPTNVLSFPASAHQGTIPGQPRPLGDIAIAFETTQREAKAEGKPFADHLSHLAVHGFLHLIGYDHETDAEAETMEALERRILAQLGIPDPYAPSDEEG